MQSWDVFFHSADLSNPRNVHTCRFDLKGVSAVRLRVFNWESICLQGDLSAKKELTDRQTEGACGLQAKGGGFLDCAAQTSGGADSLCKPRPPPQQHGTGGRRKDRGGDVQEVCGVEIWKHTAVKWRCLSRRGNQDRKGRRRRARTRVRSWRRVPAAAGRNAKSRLAGFFWFYLNVSGWGLFLFFVFPLWSLWTSCVLSNAWTRPRYWRFCRNPPINLTPWHPVIGIAYMKSISVCRLNTQRSSLHQGHKNWIQTCSLWWVWRFKCVGLHIIITSPTFWFNIICMNVAGKDWLDYAQLFEVIKTCNPV